MCTKYMKHTLVWHVFCKKRTIAIFNLSRRNPVVMAEYCSQPFGNSWIAQTCGITPPPKFIPLDKLRFWHTHTRYNPLAGGVL